MQPAAERTIPAIKAAWIDYLATQPVYLPTPATIKIQ